MKEINIICFDTGKANLTSEGLHISNENNASKLIIDFTNTGFADKNKWVDIVLTNGTSVRYDLGVDNVVELSLGYDETVPGEIIITPFILEGDFKVKYITNYNAIIRYQEEAMDEEL